MSTPAPRATPTPVAPRVEPIEPLPPAPRAPRLLALALAAVAILGIASSLTPRLRSRAELLDPLVPGAVQDVAAAATLASSVVLLILAGGLRRRKHRAWQLSVVALAGVALFHVVKGLDLEESALSVALLAALVVWRRSFDIEGDPETPHTFLRHALWALGGLVLLGVFLIETQSMLSGDSLPLAQALSDLARSAIGLEAGHLTGRGARVVPDALLVYAIVAGAWLLMLWLRPRAQYVRQHARDRADAMRLVREHGTDSLDYFALRRDKDYFFSEDRQLFIAYRVSAGVAMISGDPIGDPCGGPALLREFARFAHRHGWRIAAIGVGADHVASYEALGLRTLYIGDEAIVDPRAFSLEGRPIRKVRQSVTRLTKAGYTARMLRRDEVGVTLLAELRAVSDRWLGGEPERGFSMAIDDLWTPEHADSVFCIAMGPDDKPHGFIHFVPVPQANGLSLSAMRRDPSTPNGLMEFLLCESFRFGKERGLERISLNFNAFGELLRAEGEDLPRWERALRFALGKADRYFQVERLLQFNRKFFPRWEPRYAAFEQRRDLPVAAIVLLIAESLVELPRPLRRIARVIS